MMAAWYLQFRLEGAKYLNSWDCEMSFSPWRARAHTHTHVRTHLAPRIKIYGKKNKDIRKDIACFRMMHCFLNLIESSHSKQTESPAVVTAPAKPLV